MTKTMRELKEILKTYTVEELQDIREDFKDAEDRDLEIKWMIDEELEVRKTMNEPTHGVIMSYLQDYGCIWAHGQGCSCKLGMKVKGCYQEAKVFLTPSPVPTLEEIKVIQERIRNSTDCADNCFRKYFSENS